VINDLCGGEGMKSISQRITAIILTLVIVCAVIGSAVFSALYSSHECHGDDCDICAQLAVCDDLLETTSEDTGNLCITAAAVMVFAAVILTVKVCRRSDTLITLKTELLN